MQDTDVQRFFAEVMQRLHGMVARGSEFDIHRADIYFEAIRLHHPNDVAQGAYMMPLVTLRTRSCGWSRTSGCTMCGYHLGSAKDRIVKAADLVQQTQWVVANLDPHHYHTLVFTSNGSFLDPTEVPDAIRPELLRSLFAAGFQFIVMETRLNFVTAERLDAMADVAAHRSVINHRIPYSISFGLESQSDFILDVCINKGINRQTIVDGTALIQSKGFAFDCYVLLGKPFLSAQEDVADAIAAIRWAHDLGADYVFVMVTNHMADSLVDYLIGQSRYRLPSLWRAVRLLEELPPDLRTYVQIKGFNRAPYEPKAYATTCFHCHERVVQKLNFWNQTEDFKHIRELPHCPCRQTFDHHEWETAEELPLPQRIHSEFSQLAHELGIDADHVPNSFALERLWQS